MKWNTAIAETKYDLPLVSAESPIGNLLTDSIAWSLRSNNIVLKDEALIVIESNGLIRSDIKKGKTGLITSSDIFSVSPLGFGLDDELGYPMLLLYLTAEDLKKSMEVFTTVAPLMGEDYILQVSGIKVEYNPYRMFFDRVTSIAIEINNELIDIDLKGKKEKLYKVCVNKYLAAMLNVVGDHTGGILDIVPRDSNGNKVSDINDFIIDINSNVEGVQELKEWRALLNYVKSLPDSNGNGIADIPIRYSSTEERIKAVPNLNPLSLIGGTWLTTVASIAIIICLLIIAFIIFAVVKYVKRKQQKVEV